MKVAKKFLEDEENYVAILQTMRVINDDVTGELLWYDSWTGWTMNALGNTYVDALNAIRSIETPGNQVLGHGLVWTVFDA